MGMRGRAAARHVAGPAIAAVFALPLIFMVSGSLRRPGEAPVRAADLAPTDPSLESYGDAFVLVDLGQYLRNSLVVAAIAVPLSVLFASWAGFAIARLARSSRRSARLLVAMAVAGLVAPPTALLVGRFMVFRQLGLIDTIWPLVAPALYGMSPLFVLLYAWSFYRLPREYGDVARLAGLDPLQTWWRAALPLVRPVTVAVAILAFTLTWSNFLDPLAYLTDESNYTLPLGLRSLARVGRQDTPVLLAGAVVATAPVVVAFVLLQRSFFESFRPRRSAP